MNEGLYKSAECKNTLIHKAQTVMKYHMQTETIMNNLHSEWYDAFFEFLKQLNSAGFSIDELMDTEEELKKAWNKFQRAIEEILNKHIYEKVF